MSVTTTERTAVGVLEPRTLVDVMIDTAALVSRIGRDRVAEAHVHVQDVIVTLASGVDAWAVADELGLLGKNLAEDATTCEVERTAWGHGAVPGLEYLELHGEEMPGDAEAYAAQTGRRDAGAGLRVVGRTA